MKGDDNMHQINASNERLVAPPQMLIMLINRTTHMKERVLIFEPMKKKLVDSDHVFISSDQHQSATRRCAAS